MAAESVRRFFGWVGVVVAVMGAPLAAWAGWGVYQGEWVGFYGFLAALSSGATILGSLLAIRNLRRPQPKKLSVSEQERTLLTLAASQDGTVTVEEVAVRCQVGLAEAKAILERLCSEGIAEVDFDASDNVVYRFARLSRKDLPPGTRPSTRSPVERLWEELQGRRR